MHMRLVLGFAVTALGAGCAKRETSAPHAAIAVDVRGEMTTQIEADDFADGWSVRYERFWLSPTFGIDETSDNHKPGAAAPVAGADAYLYGGGALDLSQPGMVQAFEGWVVAGRSTGWGMRLRAVTLPDQPEREATLEVVGQATGPVGESLRFDWRFATEMTFAHCVPSGASSLLLPDGGELRVDAVLDGTALFGEQLGPDSPLRFAALAQADADADGTITTAELRAAALSELEARDGYRAPDAASLHDFMTARLVQLVAPGYTCEVSVDSCQDRAFAVGVCDDTDLADKDFDRDGAKNCLDTDIDGDGVQNEQDCDAYHSLPSLVLCNGDDLHEKDADQDGVRNCEDADIDGDGVPNERDGRPYESPYAEPKASAETAEK